MAERSGRDVSVHTIYKTKDGNRVPGVTTVLGILNKPALVQWANNLGKQGIDVRSYVDDKADIGKLAHALIMSHLRNEPFNTDQFTKTQIEIAQGCLEKYWQWEKAREIIPVLVETPLVSEKYGFGGTMDHYCLIDGVPTLLDYKTSKAIYDEMAIQIAAYAELLKEHGHRVKQIRILRIGRDQSEGFEERSFADLKKEWKIFKHCLEIYRLKGGSR